MDCRLEGCNNHDQHQGFARRRDGGVPRSGAARGGRRGSPARPRPAASAGAARLPPRACERGGDDGAPPRGAVARRVGRRDEPSPGCGARLRKTLGTHERLVTRAPGYVLVVEPGECDRDVFEGLVSEGRRLLADGKAEAAAKALREALALWRGPPFADFLYEPFAQAETADSRRLAWAVSRAGSRPTSRWGATPSSSASSRRSRRSILFASDSAAS